MKKIFWIVMAICAVLLTGCEKSAGNELVKLPENGSDALTMYYYNGKKTVVRRLRNDEAKDEIFSSIAKVNAEAAADWSPKEVQPPVYGLKLGMGQDNFEALWSNGYMITQTGETYRFEYDFADIWEGYDWESAGYTWSTGTVLPCSYYLCRDENGWIKDYLPLAGSLPEMPEILAVSSKADGDVLTVEFTNSGDREWDFGEAFYLQAQLDNEWHNIPTLPGDWEYPLIALLVMPQQTLEHDYDLSCYGELPVGKYRLVTDCFWTEFYIGNA